MGALVVHASLLVCPLSAVTKSVGQGVHCAAPGESAYVWSGHGVQSVLLTAPVVLKVPTGQASHKKVFSAQQYGSWMLKWPGGQPFPGMVGAFQP